MRPSYLFVCAALSLSAPASDLGLGHDLSSARAFAEARAEYAKAKTNENSVVRSIAHLALAQSYALEGKLDLAKSEYASLPFDAPAHHRWEAKARIEQLNRAEKGLPPWDPSASRAKIPPPPKAEVTLHVAPQGSDKNNGSPEKPFATLERARDEIRARKGGAKAFEVILHDGEYQVPETLRFDHHDSAESPGAIRYRAAQGAKPRFRGGRKLTGATALTADPISNRIPSESQSKILQIDLRANGIAEILPLKLGGFASGHGFKTHPAHELFFNGKALTLARGPNDGFLRIGDVLVKDGTKGYDREGSKIGRFTYIGDYPARWQGEPDLLLYAYWFWDWADSYERVVSIDPSSRTITLAEPFHKYGYSLNAPFYAVNALSELDQPGEWHLDRQNLRVLFYPPGNAANATIEISTFPNRMLELSNVSNIRFEGLAWELGCADAIRVSGGSNVLFAGCSIRHFAGNGIEIEGGAAHGILSCDIYSMGRGGTIISGGDRKTLTPASHFIENTEIHNLSRIDHTYTPAVILSGVGNRIAHNRFHEIPSSAMRIGGNDHLIEFNEVFNVVQESDDQGAADMYGSATYRGNIFRFNRWRHIGNWRGDGEIPKCGQAAIRLDDAISGTLVYGNIFERAAAGKIGFGAVQIHGGKDNIIDNNIFIACSAAVSFTPWNEKRWQEFIANALRDLDPSLHTTRYPELSRLAQNPNQNHIWRNRSSNVPNFFIRRHERVGAIDNVALDCCNPLEATPGFAPIPHHLIGVYADSYRAAR